MGHTACTRGKIPQFIRYCIVGGFGAGVQTVIFYALTRWLGVPDFVTLGEISLPGLWAGRSCALASNLFLNKYWTFCDK